MRTLLVTGANRGLGLEHARQGAAAGDRVIATARDPGAAEALRAVAGAYPDRVRIEALDVTDAAAVEALAEGLRDTTIDVLLNNAGTYGPSGAPAGMAYQGVDNMDYEIWRQILEVNLLAPFRLAVALRPCLARAARPVLAMMSSDLGSITQNTQGHSYAYRSSKAALNMVTRGLAVEWPGIIVVALAPGWCRTDLGGEQAPIDPADSVAAQRRVLATLEPGDSGRFIDRFGETVPW